MSETGRNRAVLPEAVVLSRLQKSDEMRTFFIEMWKRNPALARQGGARVQRLLSEACSKQRGVSLVELIMFILIVSLSLTGILSVMNEVTRHSADPLPRKQAMVIAESLLEEVALQDFVNQATGVAVCPPASAVTVANRATAYHIVSCYDGFSMNGITDLNGNPTGLANYSAAVAVAPAALGNVVAGDAVRITVTVTDPQGQAIAIDGYRTSY